MVLIFMKFFLSTREQEKKRTSNIPEIVRSSGVKAFLKLLWAIPCRQQPSLMKDAGSSSRKPSRKLFNTRNSCSVYSCNLTAVHKICLICSVSISLRTES